VCGKRQQVEIYLFRECQQSSYVHDTLSIEFTKSTAAATSKSFSFPTTSFSSPLRAYTTTIVRAKLLAQTITNNR